MTETALSRKLDAESVPELTAAELAIAALALDFAATESALSWREVVLGPYTADCSAAPLRRLADRARRIAIEARPAIVLRNDYTESV
jgi:hypothetical protein